MVGHFSDFCDGINNKMLSLIASVNAKNRDWMVDSTVFIFSKPDRKLKWNLSLTAIMRGSLPIITKPTVPCQWSSIDFIWIDY